MDIQAIGARAFSVYIAEAELTRRKLDPLDITAEEARRIVRTLIPCDALDTVSLELYPGRHEVLIFVKKSTGEPEFLRFEDFESVLAALLACGEDVTASLFFYEGSYILAVWSFDGLTHRGLAEFGEPLERPGDFLLHLREHGRVLCDGDAREVLLRAFAER